MDYGCFSHLMQLQVWICRCLSPGAWHVKQGTSPSDVSSPWPDDTRKQHLSLSVYHLPVHDRLIIYPSTCISLPQFIIYSSIEPSIYYSFYPTIHPSCLYSKNVFTCIGLHKKKFYFYDWISQICQSFLLSQCLMSVCLSNKILHCLIWSFFKFYFDFKKYRIIVRDRLIQYSSLLRAFPRSSTEYLVIFVSPWMKFQASLTVIKTR